MILWLARHAVTQAPAGLCYGRLDVAADPSATLAAAGALADALPPGIGLRTSPAARCRSLADALAALRPDLAAAVPDARLLEMDFGRWEGRTWAAIGAAAMACWTDDFQRHAPGGGESVQALLDRVARALDEDRARGAPTAWITHAGVVRATRVLATGLRSVTSASQWPQGPVRFGGWETVELD